MTQPTTTDTTSLVKTYNRLGALTSVLNASLVMFPHVAILALLGASGAWWAALAAVAILLFGARAELAKLKVAVMLAAYDDQQTAVKAYYAKATDTDKGGAP